MHNEKKNYNSLLKKQISNDGGNDFYNFASEVYLINTSNFLETLWSLAEYSAVHFNIFDDLQENTSQISSKKLENSLSIHS